MSISTSDIYDTLEAKYNATGSTTFPQAFEYALTRVLLDLASDRVGISIDTPSVGATGYADMDADAYYFGVIFDGLVYYIEDTGFWGQKGDTTSLQQKYEREMRRAHTYYASTQTVYTRGGSTS